MGTRDGLTGRATVIAQDPGISSAGSGVTQAPFKQIFIQYLQSIKFPKGAVDSK